jgi:glucosamine--fructose-6-phosphate aminotransferase (isomerizing)
MCGIIGFTGRENAVSKLMDGLSALEYRGYDSSGIAFFEDGSIKYQKAKGRLKELSDKINSYSKINTTCGIGHTRWATHGEPSYENAHPHGTENVSIVHNGIIENYADVKSFLGGKGYTFYSETDTEACAKLLDYYYIESGNALSAIKNTASHISGSYAIGALFAGEENTIYAFRKDNPLIVSPSDEGSFITSDISAVLKYTNKYYSLNEGEIVVIQDKSISFVSPDGKEVKKEIQTAKWNISHAEKGGFEHFMLKEIHEEPDALIATLRPRIKNGTIDLSDAGLSDEKLRSFKKVHIAACGTALHAGLVGMYAMEQYARIPADSRVASEFRYSPPVIDKDDLVIVISQSGETADTLAALRLAKETGAYTLAVVNVVGSAIAREADGVLYTYAGPEISVASTKAYSVQLGLLFLIGIKLSHVRGYIDETEVKNLSYKLLNEVPKKIKEAISLKEKCEKIALNNLKSRSIFFIGRGVDAHQSREAALKVKEISYIHCEAYAAGELKHGTISLIEKGTPVVAIITTERLADKMVSNIREVKARGAKVILFASEDIHFPEDIAEEIILIPRTEELFMPLVCAPLLQLTAYYMSYHLGLDVDKPRNLAKSVTVE